MKFEYMLGGQVRRAVKNNLPLVIPAGTIEYHGEHLAVGCDTLVVLKILELLEKRMPLIVAPAFYYGTARITRLGTLGAPAGPRWPTAAKWWP
jgi:creatinine amidohydrolase